MYVIAIYIRSEINQLSSISLAENMTVDHAEISLFNSNHHKMVDAIIQNVIQCEQVLTVSCIRC